ncbi:hypothetical protein M3Y94_00478300 [Aphelenchoides besseyi]|nr:hypothetical protein M3Y94_00478300 [Aphelenchoides besseyi]
MSENTSDKNVAQEQLGEMEVQDEQPTTHDQLVVQNEFQQIGDDLDDQVPHSSSKFSPPAKRLKREMEDKNESMTSESTRFERACMGGIGSPLFKVAEFVLDGRFLFTHQTIVAIEIFDLFHSRKKSFHLVNRAMIDGETANVRLCSFCPIDLHSMFVVFDSIIDARSFPVGIGTINWNDSSITFGELTVVQTDTEYVYDVRIMPKCYPPNLIDGLVLMFVFHDKRTHFHVKMHAQGQLQTTRLDSLSDKILCGVHGESAYTIDIIFF